MDYRNIKPRLDYRNIEEGTELFHPTHDIVKFVSFDYGYCYVEAKKRGYFIDENNKWTYDWNWWVIRVLSQKLEEL